MNLNESLLSLKIAVMTVSDTRTEVDDKSGKILVNSLKTAGHHLVEKTIVPDNIYQIRAVISRWIADESVQIILTTGGTGVTGRDLTPEAIKPLLDKEIEGFGEIFRMISYQEIKTSTIQSRTLAGVANGTYIFCLPGSSGACQTGWSIIEDQLDSRHRPCNLAELMPRLSET
ncbi:MAG: molybdenum cofactor biosynthesis protein B [Pleurocapsa sp. SU_5_0]|nr:molybdenum cofactor biosynthesis protein B [Pleurocapsa sp. SU_5_0]NJO98622.1 molybdenum cofactor biosynthesis protein B [Pleurocapsa sp. CRU_1_2]